MEGWYGQTTLAPGSARRWRIGPLTLWVRRQVDDITVAHTIDPAGSLAAGHSVEDVAGDDPVDDAFSQARFAVTPSVTAFALVPRPADRPLVARPEVPFTLPPGTEVIAYISVPLWVEVACGTPLMDFAMDRPSDTWFGPSPRSGSLCYAVQTHLRVNLDNVPRRPHRAVTTVRIRNRSDDPLPLVRVRLPVPELSVIAGGNGALWTELIEVERQESSDDASVRVVPGPPPGCRNGVVVGAPRERPTPHPVWHVFNSLLT